MVNKKRVTVVISDIAYFTWMSDCVELPVLWSWLADYFTILRQIITSHYGIITNVTGDSIVAVFGLHENYADAGAYQAVLASRKILQAVKHMNANRLQEGLLPLITRLGVDTGIVAAKDANDPSPQGVELLGSALCIAKRLESLGKTYGHGSCVLLSEATRSALGEKHGQFVLEPLGEQPLAGKTQPVSTYRMQIPRTAFELFLNEKTVKPFYL